MFVSKIFLDTVLYLYVHIIPVIFWISCRKTPPMYAYLCPSFLPLLRGYSVRTHDHALHAPPPCFSFSLSRSLGL